MTAAIHDRFSSASALVDEAWSWQFRGSCLSHPAEVFFPEADSRRVRRRHEEEAKRICRDCPVMQKCRDHAVKTPERYGIWGATTARERGTSW